MKKDKISTNATKIWKRLETNLTDTNIYTLKKDFNLSLPDLTAALEWLAHENKITFINYEKATYIFPVE
jgi:hypothetical protein